MEPGVLQLVGFHAHDTTPTAAPPARLRRNGRRPQRTTNALPRGRLCLPAECTISGAHNRNYGAGQMTEATFRKPHPIRRLTHPMLMAGRRVLSVMGASPPWRLSPWLVRPGA